MARPIAPPSGTITFLFTDIEGSTHLWEQYPDTMFHALARHDDILRSTVEAHGGYVFKTVGDAFCAAFSNTMDALSAIIAAQQALHEKDWGEIGTPKVRAGIHTGIVQEQDGDYFGQPLNRVARLMAAGHGGQTLLSQSSYELVRDHLTVNILTKDLGEHRLKDLIRPEHIYQMVAAGLPQDFPPLKTLDNRPNNLLAQPTALIGREQELADLHKLLGRNDVRLVTLAGPGGIGKTRLALQSAADSLDDFPDGVWFVNLAPITDPNLVLPTIAQALGVKEAGGQPLADTLKAYLKEKRLLLVVDNFEQVISAATSVSDLLSACPHLKVLVTSRIAVRLRGEHEYPVPPLHLPDPGQLPPLERLTQYEAVRLFIERATDIKPDFQVTNDNAPAVAEICVRLDGLPLAIELAAARIRLFPPQALLVRLSSRLKMLTGGARDLPARQQTIRATIEWSYNLLTEGEKQLFRRIAVFQGGRTLGGLEAVCNSEGLQVYGQLKVDVVEGVESLINNSLLQQREGRDGGDGEDGEARFWLLETIHEYAREKLAESGEDEAMQREHALYFMRLVEEAEPQLMGARQAEWLNRLEEEHDNMRAALRWAKEHTGQGGEGEEAGEIGLRIAGALWRFWYVRGYFSEGREQFSGVLALSTSSIASAVQAPPSQSSQSSQSQSLRLFRARAFNGAGILALEQGDYSAARSLFEESLAISRELGDKPGIAFSLNSLGNLASMEGDYSAARSLYEESLSIRRELGDKLGVAASLHGLGIVAYMEGDYAAARSLYGESLSIRRELGDKRGIAYALNSLANVAYVEGDYAAARSLHKESLATRRELGDKWGIALCLAGLGGVAVAEAMAEAMAIGQAQSQVQAQAWAQVERGARLRGAAERLLEAIGAVLDPDDRIIYEQGIKSARAVLGEEAFERARQEGRAMTMEQAIAYALENTDEQ